MRNYKFRVETFRVLDCLLFCNFSANDRLAKKKKRAKGETERRERGRKGELGSRWKKGGTKRWQKVVGWVNMASYVKLDDNCITNYLKYIWYYPIGGIW